MMCCQRGKNIIFRKGGGGNTVYEPKYGPLTLTRGRKVVLETSASEHYLHTYICVSVRRGNFETGDVEVSLRGFDTN
jgi:hypothetical protein